MDKKLLEADEEIEKFLEKNEVDPSSIAQSLEFEKSVFSDTDQVQDFLMAHLFSNHDVEDDKKMYKVNLFDKIGFVESTLQKLKVRDGVSIWVGVLRPMTADNPVLFDDDDSENIKLSSDLPYVIELAKTVDGFHVNYGEVKITKDDLLSFKNNFDSRVVGVDISIDFDHETREAAGWVKEVFLSEDGETLFGVIRWTPKGAVSLTDREFRYLSPEFHPNWVHPHTGVAHGPTMLGAALVNRPFLKMDAIVGLNNGKNKGVPKMDTITLADHNKKVVDMQEKIDALTLSEGTAVKTAKNLQEKLTQLSEENKTLKAEAEKKEKEAIHNKLFTDGKINKAQLDALNEGKEGLEVLALAESMNNEPKGSNEADNKTVKLTDAEKKMAKMMGQTDEEFYQYNYGEV